MRMSLVFTLIAGALISLFMCLSAFGEPVPLLGGGDPGECFVGGCSGQICVDRQDIGTTCEWREDYACYQSAACERQPDGACGWTPTLELRICLAQPG